MQENNKIKLRRSKQDLSNNSLSNLLVSQCLRRRHHDSILRRLHAAILLIFASKHITLYLLIKLHKFTA